MKQETFSFKENRTAPSGVYLDRLAAYMMDYADAGLRRHNSDEESAIFRNIANGDIDAVLARIERADRTEELYHRVGTMARNPLKNLEYMACISIALSSRAAAAGGLDLNTAYTLTDVFLRHLENCRTAEEILQLQTDSSLIFAGQVAEAKAKRSRYAYIEHAKDYIANHLNRHFTVEDIARELNLSTSYLSHRFSQEMGISIRKYTQKKRIEAAKNMLRFSDASLDRIASYLCFPTQSYFGKVFKEWTGMTPQAFRNYEHRENDPYRTPREL